MYISNMTASEEYRMTGTVTGERLEALLDRELVDTEGAMVHIDEAKSCFMDEDFLSPSLKKLGEFAKQLRGSNREALLAIVEELEESVSSEFHNGDYGRDELEKAIALLQST